MQRASNFLVLLTLSICLGSCGIWNPDPAERLSLAIEREARELSRSTDTTASFDFVPNARRVSKSPKFTGNVEIRVIPDPTSKLAWKSTIVVSDWYTTTYHNRFVHITDELKATKKPSDPFRIVLKKTGAAIHWADLQ